MVPEGRLRVKTLAMVCAMVVCANAGDLMLKRAMLQIGAVELSTAGLAHAFRMTVTSGTLWVGIFFLCGFMLSYMTVLSWADYSYVQPASAVAYGMVALLAHFMLREVVTPMRWLGVLVICLGVLVVGHTPPRTTESS